MAVKTYDPKQVVISFCGARITGFEDGTMVKVTPRADLYAYKRGTDGEGARVRMNDRGGEIEITLGWWSSSLDFLNAKMVEDEEDDSGSGAITIDDMRSFTLLNAGSAWVKRRPDVEFGKEHSPRVFVFECEDFGAFVLGSPL